MRHMVQAHQLLLFLQQVVPIDLRTSSLRFWYVLALENLQARRASGVCVLLSISIVKVATSAHD